MEFEFNWSRFNQIIENTSDIHIPPDITFKFEDDQNEIQAHKWMMGMVSPVFNKMFFVAATKDKDAKELLVKGTTFGAFNIIRNAIYGIASMENGLKGKSVREVFSVLDLVTRYQIPELQQVVRNRLNSLTLTDDTVLEVAAIAMEKSSTFEDESKKLLILCTKFLKSKLENMQAVFEYIAAHKDDMEVVHELLALMKDIAPIACPVCKNCCQEPCLDGTDIKESQIRMYLRVTTNSDDFWEHEEQTWGKGIVTQINDTFIADRIHVTVKSVSDNDDEYVYSFIPVEVDGRCVFKFDCKY